MWSPGLMAAMSGPPSPLPCIVLKFCSTSLVPNAAYLTGTLLEISVGVAVKERNVTVRLLSIIP